MESAGINLTGLSYEVSPSAKENQIALILIIGSPEFIFRLNSETLPLQNGLTVNRKVGNFLTYAITLTKIQ